MFGEQSNIVKWFTNKCPKKLESGENKQYNVTLSVLPHHIAGMSFYAPYNWGGDRWLEGWNGTSCLDTIRNSVGDCVYQVPSSMMDSTLAIAYLTESNNTDIFEPRYLARVLVRLVYVDGEPIMITCRPFFVSNEATHVLLEGLKNMFNNIHTVGDIRDNWGGGTRTF